MNLNSLSVLNARLNAATTSGNVLLNYMFVMSVHSIEMNKSVNIGINNDLHAVLFAFHFCQCQLRKTKLKIVLT